MKYKQRDRADILGARVAEQSDRALIPFTP